MPTSLREEEIFFFPFLFLCSRLWPPGQGQFKRQGLHLNKLGRGPPGDVTCYKAVCLPVSEINNFDVSFFFPTCMFQIVTPLVRGQFWPKGHHLNKLGSGPLGDGTYHISKLYAFQFQRRRILKFLFLPMFRILNPRAIIWSNMVDTRTLFHL